MYSYRTRQQIKLKKACQAFTNMVVSGVVQELPMYLDNLNNDYACVPQFEGACDVYKIDRTVVINGERKRIRANSEQEYAEKISALYAGEKKAHQFEEYAMHIYQTFIAPNLETTSEITYRRQLKLHIIPTFGEMAIEEISSDDIQNFFNGINGAKATKDKIKNVLSPIFDFAVEDGIIHMNPLKSRKVRITGDRSQATEPYSVDEMHFFSEHLNDLQDTRDRAFFGLLINHPLRLEEVLGLKWCNVDLQNMVIHIRQVATHPDRNQAEVKETKTVSSIRDIRLAAAVAPFLERPNDESNDAFIFGGNKPWSYSTVRKTCDRIKREIGFDGKITPIRFRTTVLTDIYDSTKDIKLTQAMAGHSSSTMTLERYVKGRQTTAQGTEAIERLYS